VPLTGPRALGAEVPFEAKVWIPLFLEALADEAADYLQLLYSMERAWFTARASVAGRRSTSRAAAAVMSWPWRRCYPRPRSRPGWAWR